MMSPTYGVINIAKHLEPAGGARGEFLMFIHSLQGLGKLLSPTSTWEALLPVKISRLPFF
jgi:hypothetical protein